MIPLSAVARRVLGRTGLQVSVLGFGAAPLGDLYARLEDGTAIAAVERAFELGINLLDTSPLYGHGLSEHRCGTAIRRVPRQNIVVCTKVGRWMDPFQGPGNDSGFVGGQPHRAVIDYSYDGTMRSVEQSLLRLGTDRLDLLLIHDVDVWTHGADAIEDRFREAMAGAYVALDRLRGEGVVAGIGIGVNEAEMCVRFAQAGSFDAMLLAGRYSLLGATGAGAVPAIGAATGNRCAAWWRFQFRHSGNRRRSWCQIQLSGRATSHLGEGGRYRTCL
jgi:D-threo-aldose 1-dehydrogenase